MSDLEHNCIQSWKNILPDYQIKCWNETNFNFKAINFSAKAYKMGKFAFVSDVCRLHALYIDGGIYLDTDMLIINDFEDLLIHDLFLGEERDGLVNAAIIGSSKNNSLISLLLDRYRFQEFDYNSPMDIPTFLTFNLDRTKAKVYSKEYFYPLPFSQRGNDYRSFIEEKTYAVHLWNHSWKNEWDYLHDKDFCKAITEFTKHFFSSPLTKKKLFFFIQFCKYYLVHLFPIFYERFKSKG